MREVFFLPFIFLAEFFKHSLLNLKQNLHILGYTFKDS